MCRVKFKRFDSHKRNARHEQQNKTQPLTIKIMCRLVPTLSKSSKQATKHKQSCSHLETGENPAMRTLRVGLDGTLSNQLKGFAIMQQYDLQAQYDSRASFYGKARVINNDGDLELVSYTTRVAVIHQATEFDEKSASVYGTYSQTTLRHIKEFLLQNGFKAENSKQIMADYGPRSSK